MSSVVLESDEKFISYMTSELERQLTESQAQTDTRWNGSDRQSPSVTWDEFSGNYS
ncbi:hypothetical protein LL394_001054 [Serratia marcescens]|uniref:hypothetical protein n=1 Tax=Serratia marcescens TaxID=615 RepID=UPI001A25CA99|nr:hypothetical protein [Serratia marcescens]HAT3742785.1 hypothetical protein [Serratia marcescens]HAT3801063.1 hypothetical protein [Serratia marcescens]